MNEDADVHEDRVITTDEDVEVDVHDGRGVETTDGDVEVDDHAVMTR